MVANAGVQSSTHPLFVRKGEALALRGDAQLGRLLSAVTPLLQRGSACRRCPPGSLELMVTCCDARSDRPRVQSPAFSIRVALGARLAHERDRPSDPPPQARLMCSAVLGHGALLGYPHTMYGEAEAGSGLLSAAEQPALHRLTRFGEGQVPLQFYTFARVNDSTVISE